MASNGNIIRRTVINQPLKPLLSHMERRKLYRFLVFRIFDISERMRLNFVQSVIKNLVIPLLIIYGYLCHVIGHRFISFTFFPLIHFDRPTNTVHRIRPSFLFFSFVTFFLLVLYIFLLPLLVLSV